MPIHILVTHAGSAAATMFLRAAGPEKVVLFAADEDAYAPGLYLVAPSHRLRLPRIDDPSYVAAILQLCWQHRIQILVPCGPPAEQLRITNQRDSFELMGTRVLLAPADALAATQDHLALRLACEGVVPLPQTHLYNRHFRPEQQEGPWLIRPRFKRGRGVRLVRNAADLANLPRDESYLVQEYLPGEELHVDTLLGPNGEGWVAVPRQHLRMEAGMLVAARSFHDPELEADALRVVTALGLTWAATVTFRRDTKGVAKLVNVTAQPKTIDLKKGEGRSTTNV